MGEDHAGDHIGVPAGGQSRCPRAAIGTARSGRTALRPGQVLAPAPPDRAHRRAPWGAALDVALWSCSVCRQGSRVSIASYAAFPEAFAVMLSSAWEVGVQIQRSRQAKRQSLPHGPSHAFHEPV